MLIPNIILVVLLVEAVQGENDDFVLPAPKFETTYVEPELLTHINGCNFKTTKNKSLICLGLECRKFVAPKTVQPETLIIKASRIAVFNKNDFDSFRKLKKLEIQFNLELHYFEPGCFHNMNTLLNLSISINHNLKHLDENVFEGLVHLEELYLIKNGFTKVIDVTPSLAPKYLPSLLTLYLNENVFKMIYKSDFEPMRGSTLKFLAMVLCQIDVIHPESFNPIKNLHFLYLGKNQFNMTIMENLMSEIIEAKIPLSSLGLNDAGIRRTPPYHLLELIAESNITHLNLAHNMFDNIDETSFPKMPNILELDLSNCLMLTITENTFQNLPNLRILLLNENRLSSVCSGMILKQLTRLDISGNSGNQISRSSFRIDDDIFMNMTDLLELQLAYNLITQITSSTFSGLSNLIYLDLKNASIFNLEFGAFHHLKKLKFLNLENNKFTIEITAETFRGMDHLKTLLLGGCGIEHLEIENNPFQYLKNLTFLGLRGNSIYTLSSAIFTTLQLRSLDLSVNKLLEWNDHIYFNSELRELDISQNKIKTITKVMLEDFKNLEILRIESNPFTCDCMLYPAAHWLHTQKTPFKYVMNDGLHAKCVNPDEWNNVSMLDYMGYINIKGDECNNSNINSQIIWISILSTFGLLSVILLILGYIYRLHVRHWVLLSRMALRRYMRRRRKKEGMEYKYDAFVSYSNEDQEFVTHLVNELENNPPYFKLCVYERDFQIGTAISESVLQSVASSRRTILIISESFVKSQWCRWEAKLAEHHQLFFYEGDVQAPHGTLLIILLGKVCNQKLTPTLKYLLKTRIYLQWTNLEDEQQLFWHKLRKKLTAPNNPTYETSVT